MAIRALMIDLQDQGIETRITQISPEILPEADVRVSIEWSSLNYKDALVLAGLGKLVRTYPHIPGIDLAGTVVDSASPNFEIGDNVVLTGWRVGETWWGGFAEEAQVKSEWLIACPDELSLRDAMVFGTAGLTAALACTVLMDAGISPESGPVLVTGASGGLGNVAVNLLAELGYEVVASTGKPEQSDLLERLGARHIVDRRDISDAPSRPLLVERWAGVIDAVGGTTLSHVAAETAYGGVVAMCGNASGNEFSGNVLPFLLRGITLVGVDSVMATAQRRMRAWSLIAEVANMDTLEGIVAEVSLDEVPDRARAMLAGATSGRTIVNMTRGEAG